MAVFAPAPGAADSLCLALVDVCEGGSAEIRRKFGWWRQHQRRNLFYWPAGPANKAMLMANGALTSLAHYTASVRRLVVSIGGHYLVLAIALVAMTAFTVPDLRTAAGGWLMACLWACFAYLVADGVAHINAHSGSVVRYLVSPAGIVDLLAVVPIPVALLCGVEPPTAWLLAALWVLKLAQNSPGLAQIGRVFVLEAKALASVLVLFLIVLFLSSAAMHMVERSGQPASFGTLPASLWWALVTLTTTGYGDEVPQTAVGHLIASFVMFSGIACFGLWTGILATGFAAENRRRNFVETWDLVSKVPFFQTLDPSAITEITHMLRRVEMPERTAVIRRGRVGDCMYFIASGEVQVDVPPAPVRLGEGAFFGELALLGDSIRTANVSTTKPSMLLVLDLADFRTLTARHPELARVIDVEAKRRLGDTQRRRDLQVHGGIGPS